MLAWFPGFAAEVHCMRNSLFALILAAWVLGPAGCDRNRIERKSPTDIAAAGGEAPLLLDEEPLLLDDGPVAGKSDEPAADNSRCHVCHMNYVREDIALIHARADIGCADCHGASDAHIDDESWAWGGNGTAPEVMFPRPRINPFCMGCHPAKKIDAKQHKDVLAGTGKKKYCTDCHGRHRLPERNCKWK